MFKVNSITIDFVFLVIYSLRPNDILIKGGEWKLGSDEEPLPFQLVRVKSITMHPAYQPTALQNDVALLHLENKLKFDKHIGPVCYDENDSEPSANELCVTSGWGKEVLKRMLFHISIEQSTVH